MKLSLRDFTFSQWFSLAIAGCLLAAALYRPDWLLALMALGYVGLFIIEPYVRKIDNERWVRKRLELIEARSRDFDEQVPELQARLTNRQLHYLVEWWEDDDLFIEENSHILFVFADGSSCDFELFAPIREKLTRLLADHGIEWTWSYSHRADSRIVYPPELAGQPYRL
ncbi:MAG: hypothetical protein Q4F38_10095 [Akkermansia sp.]|nr:hypothetical protein [Akkermansia sp.]